LVEGAAAVFESGGGRGRERELMWEEVRNVGPK
jgi:hypothetical protein